MAARLPPPTGFQVARRRVARRQQGWRSRGIGDPPAHIRNTVYLEGSGSSAPFSLFPFVLILLGLGHIGILAGFLLLPTHQLDIPSRTDTGELLGAVVWHRGWIGAADRGRQALAPYLDLRFPRGTGGRLTTLAFWSDRAIILALGRSYSSF